MKQLEVSQEIDYDTLQKRLNILLNHISNVRKNCNKLAQSLISSGESELGIKLIANGLIHDNSKFSGVEWKYLHGDVKDSSPELFLVAAKQHISTNPHHPEYFGSIHNMPDIYLAEHCCDILARAQEFGQNVFDWIHDVALEKYSYDKKSKIYRKIKGYMEILLEDSFK